MAGSASTMLRGCALAVLAWLVSALPAVAQGPAAPSAREGERTQLQAELEAERAALREALARQEQACYQRFAVTGCLQQARRAAREDRKSVV